MSFDKMVWKRGNIEKVAEGYAADINIHTFKGGQETIEENAVQVFGESGPDAILRRELILVAMKNTTDSRNTQDVFDVE